MKWKLVFVSNIIFFFLWLVSKTPTTDILKIVVKNNHYQVYFNNQFLGETQNRFFQNVGFSVSFIKEDIPDTIPLQPRVKRIKVYDDSGGVLFDKEDIDTIAYSQRWKNFTAEIYLEDSLYTDVFLHAQDQSNGLLFYLRPYRHLSSAWVFKKNGVWENHTFANVPQLRLLNSLKLILKVMMNFYPLVLVIFCLIFAIYFLTAFFKFKFVSLRFFKKLLALQIPFLLLFLVGSFFWLLYLNLFYLKGIPHVPDSAVYLMQAKLISKGKVFGKPGIFPQFFEFFDALPQGMYFQNQKWFGQYPFGHPLLLSLGVLVGRPWIIPPLIGTFFLLIIYLITKEISVKPLLGLLAILLGFFSPFFQMNAASFMSHNTASFYLALFIFCFLKTLRKKNLWLSFCGGVSFGLLFNTRPLTAVSLIVPFAVFSFSFLLHRRLKNIFRFTPLVVAGIVLLMLYFGYNFVLTGSFSKPPYSISGTSLGFSDSHTLEKGLQHALTSISLLPLVLFGWPIKLTFIFVFLPFILGKASRYDWLWLSSILAIFTGGLFYNGSFIMYGPRFYYEMLPFLILLAISGIEALSQATKAPHFTWLILLFTIFILTAGSIRTWILAKGDPYPGIFAVPQNIKELGSFNLTNARLLKEAQKQDIHQAIVFVKDCPYNWACYGSVWSQNNVNLNSDVVWVKDRGEKNSLLKKIYPGRDFYFADYGKSEIVPLEI
ncbi:glycosyltransferase family 39 protein [Candidatus Microgenomates bacterium]|nr:glycosyltransferase family 39 protein [Candidatus Microgenomates bacterium]